MNFLEAINERLGQLPYPLSCELCFTAKPNGITELADPYLFNKELNLRIILRIGFLFSSEEGALIIPNEEIYRLVSQNFDFTVSKMQIDEAEILTVFCGKYIFRAFPGYGYGPGIYQGSKEIMQHYGWGEGFEFDETSTMNK